MSNQRGNELLKNVTSTTFLFIYLGVQCGLFDKNVRNKAANKQI